jgi:hypothetical protein
MGRRKSRHAKLPAQRPAPAAAATSPTAIMAKPAATAVTTAPARAPSARPRQDPSKPVKRFWLERLAIRLARSFGSLQLAVILLIVFIVSLILGTLMESWYSAKVASDLVYRSWWFIALLGLLAINIFCAAAKKWPWKKHQTGFLITHVGLLMMLAGGILNGFFGTDSQMYLTDVEDPRDRMAGIAQMTNKIYDPGTSLLRIKRRNKSGQEDVLAYSFDPGSFRWRSDQYSPQAGDGLLDALVFLSHPWPHGWEQDIDPWEKDYKVKLEVLNYYPNARIEPFAPAGPGESGIPALKFALSSSMIGTLPAKWLASKPGKQQMRMGGGLIEMLGRCPAGMLKEFTDPPAPDKLGKKGSFVIRVAGHKAVFDVDKNLNDGVKDILGKDGKPSGWQVRFTEYLPSVGKDKNGPPENPILMFELANPNGKVLKYTVLARFSGVVIPDDREAEEFRDLQVWLHPPDYRYGMGKQVRGVLSFVVTDNGKLYYRCFGSAGKEGFSLETAGEVFTDGGTQPIWKGMKDMNFAFGVSQCLPNAVNEDRFVPELQRPGLERQDLPPAIRCRLAVERPKGGKSLKEFWVSKTDSGFTPVSVGQDDFAVGFNTKGRELPFKIKLLRAESKVDNGTQMPATYTSFVQLFDDRSRIYGQDVVITMNAPLEHDGLMFYQSGYQALGVDDNMKPQSQSTLSVGYDPGILWRYGALKYTGFIMLVAGIVCMFYMKAYFFKPRGKGKAAAGPGASAGAPQEP